jgi:hypothetical protein
MMKVYLLLIAICIAQCAFLQDYSEVETSCGVNVKCSMVPYVKSCEKYDYCLKDGWYYNVKCHNCQKITIKDGYYPTDNFFKTKSDCDCACSSEVSTISEYKNLDPTYECKKAPDFYSEGYSESKYSGKLWTYDWQYKKCVTFDYPVSDYQPSYNIFYNKQDCEAFCINYLYDHEHEGGDDYKYGGDDYNNYEMKHNNEENNYDDNYKIDNYNNENKDDYNNEYKDDYNNEYKDDSNNEYKDDSNNEYKEKKIVDYERENNEYDDKNNEEYNNGDYNKEEKQDDYKEKEGDHDVDTGSSLKAKKVQSQKKASAKPMQSPALKSNALKTKATKKATQKYLPSY